MQRDQKGRFYNTKGDEWKKNELQGDVMETGTVTIFKSCLGRFMAGKCLVGHGAITGKLEGTFRQAEWPDSMLYESMTFM